MRDLLIKARALVRGLSPGRVPVDPLIDCGGGIVVRESNLKLYRELQLKPRSIQRMELKRLQCEISVEFDHVLQPRFFIDEDGQVDRSIFRLPHFQLLQYYLDNGMERLEQDYRNLDFYAYYMSFNKVGYKLSLLDKSKVPVHYDDVMIWRRILKFIAVYENIKKIEYLAEPYTGHYISVLDVPIAVSRFGKDFNYIPYSIFAGHHRAVSMIVLGYSVADVLLLEDVSDGAGDGRGQSQTLCSNPS